MRSRCSLTVSRELGCMFVALVLSSCTTELRTADPDAAAGLSYADASVGRADGSIDGAAPLASFEGEELWHSPRDDPQFQESRFWDRTYLDVAVNDLGQGIALWAEAGDLVASERKTRLWVALYDQTEGWSDPEVLSRSDSGAPVPRVAIDGKGGAVAIWNAGPSDAPRLVARDYDPQRGWGGALELGTAPMGTLATTPAGDVLVVWTEGSALYGRRRLVGGSWNETEQLYDHSGEGSLGNVAIARSPKGNTVLLGSVESADGLRLWEMHVLEGESWSTLNIFDESVSYVGEIRAAINDAGDIIVAWKHFTRFAATEDGGTTELVGGVDVRLFTPANGWKPRDRLDEDLPTTFDALEVDLRDDGNALVVWQGATELRAQRYLSTTRAWQAPVALHDGSAVALRAGSDGKSIWIAWRSLQRIGIRRFELESETWEVGTRWIDSGAGALKDNTSGVKAVAFVASDSGLALLVWGISDTSIPDQPATSSVWAGRRLVWLADIH